MGLLKVIHPIAVIHNGHPSCLFYRYIVPLTPSTSIHGHVLVHRRSSQAFLGRISVLYLLCAPRFTVFCATRGGRSRTQCNQMLGRGWHITKCSIVSTIVVTLFANRVGMNGQRRYKTRPSPVPSVALMNRFKCTLKRTMPPVVAEPPHCRIDCYVPCCNGVQPGVCFVQVPVPVKTCNAHVRVFR
jgi:hypothetical protein